MDLVFLSSALSLSLSLVSCHVVQVATTSNSTAYQSYCSLRVPTAFVSLGQLTRSLSSLPFQHLPQRISRCSVLSGFFSVSRFTVPTAASRTPESPRPRFLSSGHLRFSLAKVKGQGEAGKAGPAAMFSDEELREMSGLRRGGDYIEVTCGCTSHRYGDAVGRLRVLVNGYLEITCECTPGCDEDKLTPAAFEKHSGRETSRKWKNNVWVIVNGEKVPLAKTALLRYYNQTSKNANNGSQRSNVKVFHRDEFVCCSRCNKERRFRLRTKEECRVHHDALADVNWICADLPYDNITCEDDQERASRRVYRGCSRSPTCKGCTSCICFGCEICRFTDCSCQTCMDFNRNAKA